MKDLNHPANWKYTSSHEPGLHTVISPENSALRLTRIFRLNLNEGEQYRLSNDLLEQNGMVINGTIDIVFGSYIHTLKKKDAFYLPANQELEIRALTTATLFIGAGPYEGKGRFFVRKFDPSLSLGDIRQVHGRPPYQRDVFMTTAQQDEASRLICGITTGQNGAWTSWPPHQHSKHLEEVYCYFDLPTPAFALHLCSRIPGRVEFVHPVTEGDCVVIPEGYHPTVAIPGYKTSYFWVMTAFNPESRRYDLAEDDPRFIP